MVVAALDGESIAVWVAYVHNLQCWKGWFLYAWCVVETESTAVGTEGLFTVWRVEIRGLGWKYAHRF